MDQVTRRSLPHWYKPGAAHFVTFRLAGTLPVKVIDELKAKKQRLLRKKQAEDARAHRANVHKLLFAAYDQHLDRCSSIDWLRNPRIASMLRENLYYHDGAKYVLHAYCIMPNHVHVMLTPSPAELNKERGQENQEDCVGETSDRRSPLSSIVHSLKSYTANQANRILNRSGTFWQTESYDHWVRDDNELERIVNYIRANPVSASLVDRHEDWYWSSCHDRFLMDGDTCGWLRTP